MSIATKNNKLVFLKSESKPEPIQKITVGADATDEDINRFFEFWNACDFSSDYTYSLTGATTTWLNFMFYRFRDNRNITTVPLFDTSKVINMGGMFYGCSLLKEVPSFNTSSATNMNEMFRGCTSLTTVPLFDTSKVTTMSSMFNGCTSLTSVPAFNTANVTTMAYMLQTCTSLTSVPAFDTSKVTNFVNMFNGCTSLTSVPAFNTSKVTSFGSMFFGCRAIEHIDMYGMTRTFDISYCNLLTEDEIRKIYNNLGTAYNTSQYVTIPNKWQGVISQDILAIATSKGWGATKYAQH